MNRRIQPALSAAEWEVRTACPEQRRTEPALSGVEWGGVRGALRPSHGRSLLDYWSYFIQRIEMIVEQIQH